MLPSRKQWKNWTLPSKYSALGLLAGIIGLILTLSPFGESNNAREQKFIEQLNTAQQELRNTVVARTKYSFNPDFYSQEGVISTLDELNNYVSEMSRIVDSAMIHRIIEEHGNDTLSKLHKEKINTLHHRSKELSFFLVKVINSEGSKDETEVKVLRAKYLKKLNLMLKAESDYQSFIGNLVPSDFSS